MTKTGKSSLRWLGHAFFEWTLPGGQIILFDPWTADDGNPACPVKTKDIDRADLILVSHDHFDHIGSAAALVKQTGAILGGPTQTMGDLTEKGLVQAERIVNGGMGFLHSGGADLGFAKVRGTLAFHASSTSSPLGLLVQAGGLTIYHAGDTGLFGDMALIGRLYPLDVALLPIGGVFTMDAEAAAEAVRLLKPKMVIPMHYASFPVLAPDADRFVELVKKESPEVKVTALQPGEKVVLG